MKANMPAVLLATAMLSGCAVYILRPPPPHDRVVTRFLVQFNAAAYQKGTFRAFLDDSDITPWFTPADTPGGVSWAYWNEPFEGGYPPGSSVHIGVPQYPGQSLAHYFSGGVLSHKLRVEGKCVTGTICLGSDEWRFAAIHYETNPNDLKIPVGTAITMTLEPNLPIVTPLAVTIEPLLLDTRGQAAHVQVNRAPPGTPAYVILPAGKSPILVSVAGLGRGGFWLRVSAPGTQVKGVIGRVE